MNQMKYSIVFCVTIQSVTLNFDKWTKWRLYFQHLKVWWGDVRWCHGMAFMRWLRSMTRDCDHWIPSLSLLCVWNHHRFFSCSLIYIQIVWSDDLFFRETSCFLLFWVILSLVLHDWSIVDLGIFESSHFLKCSSGAVHT